LRGFANTLLTIWTFILVYKVLIQKRYTGSLLLLLITVGLLALFSGSRGMFLMSGILPILIVYNSFVKRLSVSAALLTVFLGIVLLGILGILRAQQTGLDVGSLLNRLASSREEFSYVLLSVIDRRLDSFYPNLLHVFDNLDKFQFRFGFDYLNIILQYVPRQLWEEKPLSLVREANNLLVLQDSGGTGFSSIFEAWINFGPMGLVLNGLLAAITISFVQRLYLYSKTNHEIVTFAFVIGIGTPMVLRFFVAPGITHNSAELIFSLLHFFLASFFLKIITNPRRTFVK
jgi:hypothetical protein